jgi:hypothetical protein
VQRNHFDIWSGVKQTLLKAVLASFIMGAGLMFFNSIISVESLWMQIIVLSGLVGGGIMLYFGLLFATGELRFSEFKQILGKNRI